MVLAFSLIFWQMHNYVSEILSITIVFITYILYSLFMQTFYASIYLLHYVAHSHYSFASGNEQVLIDEAICAWLDVLLLMIVYEHCGFYL